MAGGDFRVWIGTGIAAYGLAYFLVHDVFIHQRFKWFRRTENTYFMAIRKAHKVHHKHLTKEDGECFGMLFVPRKYWQDAKRAMEMKRNQVNPFNHDGKCQPPWPLPHGGCGCIGLPFLLSFDKKVSFYKEWKYFLPVNLAVGAFFIAWDVWFTRGWDLGLQSGLPARP